MARGTGLPGIEEAGLTPLVDMTGAAAPFAELANEITRTAATVGRAADKVADEVGEARAERDALAGEFERDPWWVPGSTGHNEAIAAAQYAKISEGFEADLETAAIQHAYDIDGFNVAVADIRSSYVNGGVPRDIVLAIAQGIDKRTGDLRSRVAGASEELRRRETVRSVETKIASLDERLITLGSEPGGDASEAYQDALEERFDYQDMRMRNPAFVYSEAERMVDDEKLEDAITTAKIVTAATEAYRAAGGGMAGLAQGMRFLDENLLNGEEFADVAPERRQRLFRDSRKHLMDYSAADREERRATEEQERIDRSERRERVGEVRLQIALGEITSEEQITGRDDLDPADKASLVRGFRSQTRSEAAAERTADREAYGEYRDRALAGTLTDAAVAEGVEAGVLDAGEGRTLRGLRDNGLKPVVSDVMAPFEDEARRPGRSSLRAINEKRARAEEEAIAWARAHPESTIEDRLKAGRLIASRQFAPSPAAATPQRGAPSRSQRIAAVAAKIDRARRAGRPYSLAEQNRMRKEALDAD
jgi:hypothetical protein